MRDDVQLRVMRALFSDDVPDPRDVVIVGLADACGAFDRLLSPSELVVAQERIALLGRRDWIARAVAEVVRRGRPSPPAARYRRPGRRSTS